MTPRALMLTLGGFAFCLPMPTQAEGRVLTVALCGGGVAHIPLSDGRPLDGDRPAPDHGCCGKACHAPDPRKRAKGGCCGDAPDGDDDGAN